ncbi:adenine-specific DNA-methyltransferase [Treponema berlinense]|uniref:site-specific DNA-methyltransferase (adenine-specific) n=1 Tax=Treponema berlinense TaxID=225004 RepID=A0A1T4PXN2_9SPIR|nr:DNA adenine methylase [Treponema berlinense]SJZ96284.1 adenine-specific DNA-methyltransferase [Treponema berlinense]
MNYIGSKLKLCQHFLPETIKSVCGTDLSQKTFCDIFAGTGIVGRTFKTSVKKVISNDIEYYSYILNKNYIENHRPLKNAENLVSELNELSFCVDGFIYKNYCLGGNGERQYFSDENGKKIDSIRIKIEEWKNNGKINKSMYYFLLASLLESADKVANTASVYGAYLKNLKKSAKKQMILESADFELNDNEHEVFKSDANELITRISGDILYLDPPYNTRQYGANYHILNTIAEYKPFVPKGKTGLREYTRSKYCSVSSVKEEFENLIKNANFKYIFLSYNNEGLMSVEDVRRIMRKYGRYDLAQTDYQRFKADSNRFNKAKSTVEYLHILEKN